MLAHQLFHRIHRVEPPRPEVLVVPGILADGNGQPDAVQFHHLLRPRRRKVALLIENVVKRQQTLVLFEKKPAAIQQNGGIHRRLAAFATGRQRHPRQNRGRKLARSSGQLIDGCPAASQKARFLKKVGRGIATDCQLGKNGQTGA